MKFTLHKILNITVHFLFLKDNHASTRNRGKVCPGTVREVEIIGMPVSFFLMMIISASLTVPGQLSPRFHVEAWLHFRNREMDYYSCLPECGKYGPWKYPYTYS